MSLLDPIPPATAAPPTSAPSSSRRSLLTPRRLEDVSSGSTTATSGASILSSASSGASAASAATEVPAVANVPLQVAGDCEGRVVTAETTAREVYRGRLAHFDRGSMNMELEDVVLTKRDLSCVRLQSVYLRGDKARSSAALHLVMLVM